MAQKPSKVCRVCQRKNCDEPSHQRTPRHGKPFENAVSGRGRIERKVPYREQKRRREAVAAWIAEHGHWCPECGAIDYHDNGAPVVMTADHITPVSEGGPEDGPLRVTCFQCQRRQGALLRNKQRRGGGWRPYSSRPYRMSSE